jgi:hypothetical protein
VHCASQKTGCSRCACTQLKPTQCLSDPASRKHLIVVHGRGEKPRLPVKIALIEKSVLHGLSRVDSPYTPSKIHLPYYGDINSTLLQMLQSRVFKRLRPSDVTYQLSNATYEPDNEFDEALSSLFARPTSAYQLADYLAHRKERGFNTGFIDELLAVLRPGLERLGLGKAIIRRFAPEVILYFERPGLRQLITARLHRVLMPLLTRGESVLLVAHSMGCIVAVDMLLKVPAKYQSQLQLLSLGSPLADPVIDRYFAHHKSMHCLPITRWDNLSAHDDMVAYTKRLTVTHRSWLQDGVPVTDALMCNFFAHPVHGINPHKSYGYLDSPVTAQIIADWLAL